MRAARALAGVVGVGILIGAAGLAFSPPAATEASWARATYGQGGFTAGLVPAPGALTCSGGGTFVLGNTPPSVTFAWAAPATPANALPITDYYWTLTQGATLVSFGTSPVGTRSAVIGGTLVVAGTYTFTVIARGPSGWNSVAGPTGTYTKTNAILGVLLGTSGCSVP